MIDNGYCSRCGARFPHVFTQRYPLPDGGVWCGSCDPDDPSNEIDARVATNEGMIDKAPGSYLCLTEQERIDNALRGIGCVMDGPHAGEWVPATHERIEMPIIGPTAYSEIGEQFKPKIAIPHSAFYRRVQRADGRLYFYVEDK